MSHFVTNDHIRPATRTPSNAGSDSRDPLDGSFIDSDGKRRKFIGRQLHVWTGSTWIADSIRVNDSREPEKIGYAEYHRLLADQNRAALERTGVDEPEGSESTASGSDSRTPHERYLDELKRQNIEGLK